MTEQDKADIANIVRAIVKEESGCALGIKPETATELINFADTWKYIRRNAVAAIVIAVVGGLATAVLLGIKLILKE